MSPPTANSQHSSTTPLPPDAQLCPNCAQTVGAQLRGCLRQHQRRHACSAWRRAALEQRLLTKSEGYTGCLDVTLEEASPAFSGRVSRSESPLFSIPLLSLRSLADPRVFPRCSQKTFFFLFEDLNTWEETREKIYNREEIGQETGQDSVSRDTRRRQSFKRYKSL
jgi:hypothetical protein